MPLLTSCPTIIVLHSMHLNYGQESLPWWRRLYGPFMLRASAQRAKAYVAVSNYTGRTFLEMYGLPSKQLFVSPEGFNCEVVGSSYPKANPVGVEYLLFVSTLFPHKNVPFLLRVFAQVAKIRPSTALVIVGRDVNGSLEALKRLSGELSISDRVHFTGAVTDDELMGLYAHARLFVFPSLIEGFGLSVLEAMAHSVAVVTSNCTSLPEVVGEAGIILDPDDEGAWVETILKILEDEELHHELSLRASDRAKTFTWRRTAEITLDCFNTVLEAV
jgi:glycosyltransferase involved in cell wall biosynthesis